MVSEALLQKNVYLFFHSYNSTHILVRITSPGKESAMLWLSARLASSHLLLDKM